MIDVEFYGYDFEILPHSVLRIFLVPALFIFPKQNLV